MAFTLLLTDNRGALGRALEHELEREFFKLVVPAAGEVDWREAASVADYVQRVRPDIIINCVGWEDVPVVQQQELLLAAARHLAQACTPLAVPLIHFSSYTVFGSDTKSIHSEKDEPVPVSDLGRAFLAAEQVIAQSLDKWICLRLSWVISSYGDNHLTRLLSSLMGMSPETPIVHRRLRGAPTTLSDVARVAVAIAKQISCGAENWGVMHYCSGESCTEAEFAAQVVQTLQQLQVLDAEASVQIEEALPEHEPISAVLICRRVRDYFGIQARAWRPSLLPLVKQWLHTYRDDG
jgi:dTDP-4-dehydrorhamnose reductase